MLEYVRRARLIIGVDTGFTHLAQMFDIPLVAIYGATAPGKTGPLGLNQRIVSASSACAPCFKRDCRYSLDSHQYLACVETIQPEDIYQSALDLL